MKTTLLITLLFLAPGCNALVQEKSNDRAGGEETPPDDGPTLPVDVAGSYLVGVGPAGAEAPAGFGTPAEEVFGAALFKRTGVALKDVALTDVALVKVTGNLGRVLVELALKDGRNLRPHTVAAPPLSRWHVFFRVDAGLMADVASISFKADVDGVPIAPPAVTDFAFVPPPPPEAQAIVTLDSTVVDPSGGQTPGPAPAPGMNGGDDPTVKSLTLATVVADGYLNASEASTAGPLLASHPEGATRYAYIATSASCVLAMPSDTTQPDKGAFMGGDGEYEICAHQPLGDGTIAYWVSPSFVVDRTAPATPTSLLIRGDSPTVGLHASSDDDLQIFPAWSAEDGTYGLLEI